MMIPTNCGNCVFWDKHPHSKANWGVCKKVDVAGHSDQACLIAERDTFPYLHTRDVFFCAEWVYKQSAKQFTIVDAAREAAKKLKQHKHNPTDAATG